MDYQPTIGLEVHVELKTKTKMFCDCPNDPAEKHPNHNVCPVCLGHPGTLPVINKEAVKSVIRVGLALGGKINPITKFDRKNYFYPDLPKGYQISQYDQPIVLGGKLQGVRLRRVHLEEDTGTLIHETREGRQRGSLVDFNRAGIPLMELVTEPDITSAEQAVKFSKELQLILRYLGVSEAEMEKGQMRIEANVSLQDPRWKYNEGFGLRSEEWLYSGDPEAGDRPPLNAKVEIKNINSFKAVSAAIAYELARQKEILEKGGTIKHETRGWEEAKQETVSQRSKEEAHDYRYFPEPDLPPIETSVFNIEELRASLPELPAQKLARFQREFNLSEKQAALLIEDNPLADFFEEAVSELATRDELTTSQVAKSSEELLFNYLTSDLRGLMNEAGIGFNELSSGGGPALGGKINPEQLAHLVDLIADGKIMSRQAKDILRKMFETGEDPENILLAEGLHTVSGEAELQKIVEEVLAENPQAVADYKKGKAASLQFLIGKAMKKLKGRGNPETLRTLLEKRLAR
jgi:aspartyl-tRNA(Asn)/glutamyl-tRNA(Gln) amidotransferase subunit B